MLSSALGAWFAADYDDTTRQAIPNRNGTGSTDANLLGAPRRLFSPGNQNRFWSVGNCTVTDCAETAPDGSQEASTLVTTGSQAWSQYHQVTLPAGTYTLAISVKNLGVGTSDFSMGTLFGSEATKSATTSWGRFTHTFVLAAPESVGIGWQAPGGGSEANFAYVDFELFSGASDLRAATWDTTRPLRIENGDLIVGKDNTETATISDGDLVLDTVAHIQLPTFAAPDAMTIMFTGKRRDGTLQTWEPILAQAPTRGLDYDDFTFGQDVVDGPDIRLAGSEAAGQVNDGLFGGCEARYTFAITFDGATQNWFVNGALVHSEARATAVPELGDMFVGVRDGLVDFSNYNLSALAIWDSALSATDVRAATDEIEADLTMPARRLVVLEGDSITNQQTPRVGYDLVNPGFGWNHAVINSTITGATSLEDRAAMVDAILASAPSGTTGILTVLIGANDLAGAASADAWLAELQSYLTDRKAAGWQIVLCTVLPRGDSATHNTRRNYANPILRTWVGTYCDAIADYAADPIMGPDDSFTTSPARWTDAVHPNASGHDLLVPILAAAIDSL